MLSAEVFLPGRTSSVPTARHFVTSILTSWGYEDHAWNGGLLVSELAANCALHARTDFSVRVSVGDGGVVRVEVADASPRVPVPRAYGVESTTGRGLRLVAQLSAQWGVDARPDGKAVWVVLGAAGVAGDDELEVDEDALLAAFSDEAPEPSGPAACAA